MTTWQITISQEIRFIDLDAMGHVNNAHYLTYFEQARVAFFEAFWEKEKSGPMTERFPFVIAKADIEFLLPIELHHAVETAIRVSHIGTKSFHFEYEIRANGVPAARAKTVQVAYDYVAKAPMVLPDKFKEKLSTIHLA